MAGFEVITEEIFRAHKSQLFALNIRNYIGDNATNKAIRKTAISNASRFYYYNNGISALATRIGTDENDRDGRTLKCEALSIINGAQTVKSLLKAQGEDSAATRGVEVLMRITEFRSKKTVVGEQEFLDSVTRFNNTQNAVRTSDFRSNDRVQFDLRKKFESLPSRKGRRFEYKNKRSSDRDALKIFVPMEDFTKTVYSFLFGPDDVFGGTQHLFDSSKDGGYMKLFGADGEIPPVLGDGRFRELTGIWLLSEYVKDLWVRLTATPDEALERRWMVFYAVGESLRQVYGRSGKDVADALRTLCDPTWYLKEDQTRPKSVLKKHFTLAVACLKSSYAKARQNQEFRHRNWFRSPGTLDAVKAEFDLLWPVISDSRDDYIL